MESCTRGKKKKKKRKLYFLKEWYSRRSVRVLLRWPSEAGKSGQLFSSMIQDGKKVFEQRACVGYNEAKAEPLHPYFALL